VVSDYLQVNEDSTNFQSGPAVGFKKRLVGRKRQAEEDIVSILEERNEESGLGTKQDKQKQLEIER
jgi:hypothetical protein